MLWLYVLGLVLSLAFILYSCELFTNGIEWFGKKLNFGEGAVGSVLAAVGTALPETIIPIIAILFGANENSYEVGVGAIAGAPFMLSTLAFFITGLAVIVCSRFKQRTLKMDIDTGIITRDLRFFLLAYGIAISSSFVPSSKESIFRIVVGVFLILFYAYYVYITFSNKENDNECKLEKLLFSKYFGLKGNLPLIIIQVLISLAGIVVGAKFFVDNMINVSESLHIPALILSIILTPIATELPEKFNSIIWVSKKKDTLALGNITGAMVFQSCFPVAFGVIFTDWKIVGITFVSAMIALFSGLLNLIYLKIKKTINPYILLFGGLFYALFIGYIILSTIYKSAY